jgi:hypothetical protein
MKITVTVQNKKRQTLDVKPFTGKHCISEAAQFERLQRKAGRIAVHKIHMGGKS